MRLGRALLLSVCGLVTACGAESSGGACDDCEPVEWPDWLLHTSHVDFVVSSQARNLGYDDCVADVTAELFAYEVPATCPGCDQAYQGVLEYEQETCSAQVGMTAPKSARFGMNDWAGEWEVWGLEPDETWARIEVARLEDDGTRVLVRSETVFVDGPFGPINAGQLEATMIFEDPELP